MTRKRNFVASLSLQYALFFCLGLNLSRALPYRGITLPFRPQSVASHCDMLLLTRSGHLCNVLVRKLLRNNPHSFTLIFSRLHRLNALPPTSVMDLSLYERENDVRLSIHQDLPPFLVSTTFDSTSLMLIKMGSEPTILQTRQQCKSSSITSVSFPKSGSYIVMNGVGNNDADLFCVSGKQMNHVATLSRHSDRVSSYSIHPTLHILATASFEDDSTIRIWDVSDPSKVKCLASLEGHIKSVFSVAFHPNLPILASGGTDNIPILWFLSPESFSLISKIVLPKQESWILDVDFHPNLPILAIAFENGGICLWKLSHDFSSVICSEIIGHGHYARCLKFHPFLPILVTSGNGADASVKFWHVSTNSPTYCIANLSFQYQLDHTNCIAFHPELPIMAFANNDQSLVLVK